MAGRPLWALEAIAGMTLTTQILVIVIVIAFSGRPPASSTHCPNARILAIRTPSIQCTPAFISLVIITVTF